MFMATKKKVTSPTEQPPIRIIIEVVIKDERERSLKRNFAGLAEAEISSSDELIESFDLRKLPPVEIMVKQAILKAAGRSGNPEDLSDDAELSDLFSSNAQYILLRAYLEGIARLFKPTATISLNEVMGCTTVGDCIDLVKSKI